jgi:hypothetical protein
MTKLDAALAITAFAFVAYLAVPKAYTYGHGICDENCMLQAPIAHDNAVAGGSFNYSRCDYSSEYGSWDESGFIPRPTYDDVTWDSPLKYDDGWYDIGIEYDDAIYGGGLKKGKSIDPPKYGYTDRYVE